MKSHSLNNIENSLFTEKYRPKKLDDYIGSEALKQKIQRDLDNDDIRHMCFFGPPGVGKTSLAMIIGKTLDADVLYINAADENNVETVRTKIKDFASSMGFKKWRIVILDEASYITTGAQSILNNIMEAYSGSCRFILTSNYIEKIIPSVRSRCACHHIVPPSKVDVGRRIVQILKLENIEFKKEDLRSVINKGYPDIRSILNMCQDNIIGNKLQLDTSQLIESDYCQKILDELLSEKNGKTKYSEIRQILADSKNKSFEELYTFLYSNLDKFKTELHGDIIIQLAEAQYHDSFVVDKEINVMALLICLIRIIN